MMRRKDLLKCTREFYKLLPAIILLTCSLLVKAQTYEAGFITVNQPNRSTWFKATFKNTYNSQPIVIAGPLTDFSVPTVGVRIRHVTPNGFEYQLEETEYNDGVHREETFAYLAIEQGVHAIGDQVWEAGSILGDVNSTAFQSVSLTGNFSDAPIVLTQLASNEDPIAGITRVRDVTATNFAVKVDEEQREDRRRAAADSIHYLAIQKGGGIIGSKAYAAGVALEMDHTSKTITFPDSFSQPIFLAGAQTVEGNDPYFLRYNKLHNEGTNVRLHEERSGDNEISHPQEEVGYLVLEANEPLNKRLLWYENFSGELANGTTTDEGATKWSVNSTTNNRTSRQAYRLESRGDEAIWTSEVIPISGYSNVKISAQLSSNGTLELDDYLELYYRLNDGPETPLLNGLWIGGIGTSTMAMAGGLTGNSVQIIAKFKSNANDEAYYIDDIRIFTESNDRYAIQDGGWDDSDTWSYTPNGPSCSCIPDQLSNTYINNKTVDINQHSHTRNLTVSNNGILQGTAYTKGLMLWGNATLEIQSGGQLSRSVDPFVYVKFVQWNDRETENDQDRVGLSYPEVDVIIDVGSSASVEVRALMFNATGKYTIQGNGSISTFFDWDINHKVEIINNLTNTINIGDDISLNYPGIVFTNNGTIITGRDDGNMGALKHKQSNTHLINNGSLQVTAELETPDTSNSLTDLQVINRGNLQVDGTVKANGNYLTIDNEGTIDLAGDITATQEGRANFYNRTGATWMFGGENIDRDIYLFAEEKDNEVHYNGSKNQPVLIPHDINDPSQPGPYWHLILSNISTTGGASIKTPQGTLLNVDGNLTVIGTTTGNTTLNIETEHTNIDIAGDWWRYDKSATTYVSGSLTFDETVTFNGNNDQRIRTYERYISIAVRKTGQLLLEEGSSLASKLILDQGIILAQNDMPLVFRTDAHVMGASNISHVQGKVTKQGSAEFNFPVGNGTYYRPASISNLDQASDFTAEYFATNPGDDGFNTNNTTPEAPNVSNCEYWQIERSNGSASAQLTLTWGENSCPVDLNDLTIAHWNGTQWVMIPSTVDVANQRVTSNTSLTEFGIFTLTTANDAPLAINDTVTTPENTVIEINVPLNDSDRNGLDLTSIDIKVSALHGSATINPATGAITYTPEENFNGTDSLIYTIQDTKRLVSNPATVIILVNPENTAPIANSDTYTINEDTMLEDDVLTNDSDTDNSLLTASISPMNLPKHGKLSLNQNGTFTYTPQKHYHGTDQFIYQACDDSNPSLCDTAKVSISITPVNDAPTALADTFTIAENEFLQENLLTNDYDVDGDSLINATVVTLSQNGTVDVKADGRFTYQPFNNYTGEDTFTYQVCDNQNPALCTEATVTVRIRAGLLSIPKGFSPNGDNSYDEWIIGGIRGYADNTVSIFNRWGSVVFKAGRYDNTEVVWDGNSSNGFRAGGPQLPDGVYFYVINLGEGQPPLSGFLVLKR